MAKSLAIWNPVATHAAAIATMVMLWANTSVTVATLAQIGVGAQHVSGRWELREGVGMSRWRASRP